MTRARPSHLLLCVLAAAGVANAQMVGSGSGVTLPGGWQTDGAPTVDLTWYTIDGGGTLHAQGGPFEFAYTVGQPDAGVMVGDDFQLSGGFWVGLQPNTTCYANCDDSTGLPLLNVNDFVCFQNRFAAGDPYANCDGSTTPPVLNVNDFLCFVNQFAIGCP